MKNSDVVERRAKRKVCSRAVRGLIRDLLSAAHLAWRRRDG
jgi:hypothetical protein